MLLFPPTEEAVLSRARLRRLTLMTLSLTLVATLLPAAPGTIRAAPGGASATRFAGATPYEAAVGVSAFLFPDSAPAAVLARPGAEGPAEFGPSIAAAVQGPLLFADQSDVPDVTMNELGRLSVTTVYLMGGPDVFDSAAHDELALGGFAVERLANSLEAAEFATEGGNSKIAYLVSDAETADQFAAGPAAANNGTAVLEIAPGTLPDDVELFLAERAIKKAVLVGDAGDGDDGRTLAGLLEGAGVEPVVLFGRTVPETSVALAETGFRNPETFVLTRAISTPDMLLAAAMGAVSAAPLLYVDDLGAAPTEFVAGALSAHATNLTDLWVVGDVGTISDSTVDAALEAAEPTPVMTVDRLRRRLDAGETVTGTAWTVIGPQAIIPGSSAIDPVAFSVRVVDVEDNGVAAGIPMILVRASGDVIDLTEGIVSGMSGSPVYVEDEGETKLLGAVAFGCFFCDQRFGGVTPAENMLDVLTLPGTSGPSSLSGAKSTTVSSRGAVFEMRNLMALGIDGTLQKRFRRVAADLDRAGFDFNAVRSFGAGNFGAPVFRPFDPLFPGHSIAGVISTGTLSFGGIGTTTFRSGDRSLGFGHPFFLQGASALGLASARISDVLADKSQTFGGFKLGSVTGAHGIMDQDRFAAVAGTEGTFPEFVRLPSVIRNLDSGQTFRFRTDSVMLEFFPDIAAIALLSGLDRAFDRIGGGTAVLNWVIEGRRRGGKTFRVARGNRYANRFDVAFESTFDLLFDLLRIQENDFEEVTFDRVGVSGNLTTKVLQREIVGARARSKISKWVRAGTPIRVAPGGRIELRVLLKERRGNIVTRQMEIRVPRRGVKRGRLVVRGAGGGGGGEEDFFFDHEDSSGGEKSLDAILAKIKGSPRSDVLRANLRASGRTVDSSALRTTWVLSGRVAFPVRVVR